MNRTDRLYAIAEELRRADVRGRTSASLAGQFEVSPRTIKRDITALQQSGLPIWGEGRPGGGYKMLRSESTLPPVRFTPGEAVAIAAALESTSNLPFATDGRAALSKLLWAMTPDAHDAVSDLLSRIWVRHPPARSAGARVIDEAIRAKRVVRICYIDAAGTETARAIEPLQFAQMGGRWYLMAYCRLRDDGRWFRLDRIDGASLTGEPVEPRDIEELFGHIPEDARSVRIPDEWIDDA